MITGTIRKLTSQVGENGDVSYHLPIGDESVALNPLISKRVKLTHSGNIYCSNCAKKTKKSYSQGFCYVCMSKLAACDMCIMKPETCHYHLGTCREPEWGEKNCFIDHYVYLSNTSGLKVGITRHSQVPTRWVDQGAIAALPIFKVSTRLQSGLVETALSKFINDKTNWRKMLKGETEDIDLRAKAKELLPLIEETVASLKAKYGDDAIEVLSEQPLDLSFPVVDYPTKVTSFNFDKNPEVEGVLKGIKGQYLIFDTGVINIRKFGSYEVTLSHD